MAEQSKPDAGPKPFAEHTLLSADTAIPRPGVVSIGMTQGLVTAAAVVVLIAALSLGRALFLPLALAFILSFLLAPLATRLQRWGFGRVLSALIGVVLATAIVVTIGLTVAYQVVHLAGSLPQYQANIEQKVNAVTHAPAGPLNKLKAMFRSIERTATAPSDDATGPDTSTSAQAGDAPETPEPAAPKEDPAAAITPMSVLRYVVGPTLGPLSSTAVVVVVLIFSLLERGEIRARLLRLLGSRPGQLYVSTQTLDDASARVSRFLLMQLVINVTYGVPICIGLYFIGVPSPFLWALLTMVLRFIPYVGPIIGGALPVLLALAVDPGWSMFLWTLSLFVVVEVISNNVLEPLLYGRSTGISPLGIILSAIFWAWLWGPLGLVLATPLTVCFVVLGQYIPGMRLFPLLLGDQPVLPLHARIYQRLLAMDADEPDELSRAFLAEHSLDEYYSQELIPLLLILASESQFHALEAHHREFILDRIRELIDDMANQSTATKPQAKEEAAVGDTGKGFSVAASQVSPPPDARRVLVLPFNDASDELSARMLVILLQRRGIPAHSGNSQTFQIASTSDQSDHAPGVVCLSSLSTTAVVRARRQVVRARGYFPDSQIILGLWTSESDHPDFARRLGPEAAVPVVTNLKQAVDTIANAVSR